MEFEIKGENYRLSKLDVFTQFRVTRKLLPALAGMLADFRAVSEKFRAKDAEGAAGIVVPKIAHALADMSDGDVNAILFPCLSAVSRQHGKSWVPVCQGDTLAFDDIDLLTMLTLVARVVADSLGNFLRELPTAQTPDLTMG